MSRYAAKSTKHLKETIRFDLTWEVTYILLHIYLSIAPYKDILSGLDLTRQIVLSS